MDFNYLSAAIIAKVNFTILTKKTYFKKITIWGNTSNNRNGSEHLTLLESIYSRWPVASGGN